jgi:hypothetical protein
MTGEGFGSAFLSLRGVDQPGMLLLECWHGQLLTSRKQVVVMDDPEVVRELNNKVGGCVAGALFAYCGECLFRLIASG